jgi:hypothetical protein
MNTNTGELRLLEMAEAERLAADFIKVPDNLRKEAAQELNGRDSCMVDMTKNTPLVHWAKQSSKKKKTRAKMVKASRKKKQRLVL